jgi:hypothetical protein
MMRSWESRSDLAPGDDLSWPHVATLRESRPRVVSRAERCRLGRGAPPSVDGCCELGPQGEQCSRKVAAPRTALPGHAGESQMAGSSDSER